MKITRASCSALCGAAALALIIFPASAQDSARLAARYRQMLEKNPTEGVALDRLWKIAQENSTTAQLLDEYKAGEATNDFSATMIHGFLLRKAGDFDASSEAFRNAAAINPQSPMPHLALAEMLQQKPDTKNAAAEFEKAVTLFPPADPALPDLLLKLGTAWLAAGEPEKAAAAWERTVALDPKNLELQRRLAETYTASNLPDKALPHYEILVADGDAQQRALALQSISRIHQLRGDIVLAADSLEKAIALVAPGNWLRHEMQAQLIRLYQRSHRTAELEQKWKSQAAENPRDAGVHLQLADFYDRLGQPEQEREWLEKLHALAPANTDHSLRLARLCMQLGQTEPAAEFFDEILKEQPGNADVIFVRAEIDLLNNSPQSARERIEKFLRQHKEDELLTAKAVEFFLRHRMPDAAEEHLKSSAAQDDTALLALANFYFSQQRAADAKQLLQRLVKSSDSTEKQAAAHFKIAGILKEQKDLQGVENEFVAAEKLHPESAVYHLALCELYSASGRFDEAQAEAEKALELSKEEASRSEADEKLFRVFQMRDSAADAQQKARTPGNAAFAESGAVPVFAPFHSSSAKAKDDRLKKYVEAMVATAEKNPSSEAMLRVARWQMWRLKTKEALDFSRRAIELNSGSDAARELFVKIASHDFTPQAIEQLHELAKIDPQRAAMYSRRIGRLLLESGQTDSALAHFSEMEKVAAGDPDVLADLAAAQQQSSRWDEAAAAWQRALGVAPIQRRKEFATSLVRVLEHNGSHENAAAILLKVTNEQADDAQHSGAFEDLLAYCTKHDRLAWLQQQFEGKLRTNPDDYFSQLALSKILKAVRRDADAITLLNDAAFAAEDQLPALRQLVAEAEDAGDFDSAVQFQKRVVALSRQDDATQMEKLAALQEAKPDHVAAAETWKKIAAKFPRDPEVLSRAADYFQRWNDNAAARDFFWKSAGLEPQNLQTWTRLGELADAAGDSRDALSCYENVLKNSTAENAAEVRFPGVKPLPAAQLQQSYFALLRLRTGQPNTETMRTLQSFWTSSDERSASATDLRLHATRRISEVLESFGDKAARQAWLDRWKTAQPPTCNESLWAFYFSKQDELVMKQVDAMMQRSPNDRLVQQGFVWLALKLKNYDALHRWIDGGRTADERDLLLVSLGQLASNGGAEIDPQLADGLFPPQFKSRQLLWQAAVIFASKGCFAVAEKLGERVLSTATGQQAAYGLELAHWHIYSGDIEGARRVLRIAISGTGDSADAPIYAALREYFLLLPEGERDAFIAEYAVAAGKNPLHSALSLALLYGLHDDPTNARKQLAKIVALRPVSTRAESELPTLYRVWNFILTTGLQFQAWRLNSLAVDLWELALADTALIRLQGDAVADNVRDIRLQLLVAKLAATTPEECDSVIDGLARSMTPESLFTLGNVLENSGATVQAVKVYRLVWKLQPKNQNVLQRLLNTCNNTQDFDTQTDVLRESFAAALAQKKPDAAALQTAVQLSRSLEKCGRPDEALRVIGQVLPLFPDDAELLLFCGDFYQREKQNEKAVQAYRRLLELKPDNDLARWTLFHLLAEQGKNDGAIALVDNDGALTNIQTEELARLYFKTGQAAKAEQLANKNLQGNAFDRMPGIATVFDEYKRNGDALKFLQAAIARCKDAAILNRLEARLFDLLPEDAPAALQEKCFARLRSRRANSFKTKGERKEDEAYYNLLERLSEKFHREEQFTKELEDDWRNGSGSLAAGLRLLRIHEKNKRPDLLQKNSEMIFRHPDFTAQTMNAMRSPLEAAKCYDLLEKGYTLLCERDAMQNEPFINRARALVLLEREQDAWDVLERLGVRHIFSDEVAGMVAEEYVRQKNDIAAEKWFRIAMRQGPRQNPDVFFDYARLLIDRKDFVSARHVLLEVYRGSGTQEVEALARYFIESGRDASSDNEVSAFSLPPAAVNELRANLAEHFCEGGQAAKAVALTSAHPEILAVRPGLHSKIREAEGTDGASEKLPPDAKLPHASPAR